MTDTAIAEPEKPLCDDWENREQRLPLTDPLGDQGPGVTEAGRPAMTTKAAVKPPRTERLKATDHEASAQPGLPLRLPEQRRTRDPVPEKLVRQLLEV